MFRWLIFSLALPGFVSDEPTFPLRTDRLPKAWKLDQINNGLPYRWEKGTVHVLAWEVIEDDRPHRYTQILVLKKFDQPTEQGGYGWVLAKLYLRPEDDKWPWWGPRLIPRPVLPGEKMPKLTDAQVFGHTFYNELPTDKQLKVFFGEARWTPHLGSYTVWGSSGRETCTAKLNAGGIDRTLWKKLFGRDVPVDQFPELKNGSDGKK